MKDINPVNLIKNYRPGWQFWLALPILILSLIFLIIILASTFVALWPRANEDNLGGMALFLIVPGAIVLLALALFTLKGLALKSVAANVIAAFAVPIGYDRLIHTFLAWVSPATINHSGYMDNKLYVSLEYPLLTIYGILFILYLVSAWRIKKSRANAINNSN